MKHACWFCGAASTQCVQFRLCFVREEGIDYSSHAYVCSAHEYDANELQELYCQWRYIGTLRNLVRALEKEPRRDQPLIDEQRRRYEWGQLLFNAMLTMSSADAFAWVDAQKGTE